MPRQRIARDHPRQQEKGVNGEQDPGAAEETWNMAKGSQSTQSSLLFAVSAVCRDRGFSGRQGSWPASADAPPGAARCAGIVIIPSFVPGLAPVRTAAGWARLA